MASMAAAVVSAMAPLATDLGLPAAHADRAAAVAARIRPEVSSVQIRFFIRLPPLKFNLVGEPIVLVQCFYLLL